MFVDDDNGKEYFGKEFVDKISSIFDSYSNSNFIFVHGSITRDDAEQILKNGLQCDYPEMYYTSELVTQNDKLLFDKFRSWPHWDRKYLVMITLSKLTGMGGYPIWQKGNYEEYLLSPEFILGYINVPDKKFIDNPLYKQKKPEDYLKIAQIQDRSYEVKTGKLLGITIPEDEAEFYDCDLEP